MHRKRFILDAKVVNLLTDSGTVTGMQKGTTTDSQGKKIYGKVSNVKKVKW